MHAFYNSEKLYGGSFNGLTRLTGMAVQYRMIHKSNAGIKFNCIQLQEKKLLRHLRRNVE